MEQTQKMVDFILNLKYEDIPAVAIANPKGRMLDSIGCALLGSKEETGHIIKRFLEDNGGNQQGTAINIGVKTSSTSAAFANGALMHALNYDNNSMPAMAHTTACILSAALSVAERVNASGKELLTAYIIGNEIFNKVAACVSTECWYKGFHATGIFGA